MTGFLSSVFFFIVAIGVLITIHEYGHYIVARGMGVKVLRFSIGFGKPLWTWRAGRDQTEYVIAALPLGGYVQMLDEREGAVPEGERHRTFNSKSLGSRTAIIAAGPVFNFLLAIVAYWLVFVIGISGVKPIIGDVHESSLAAHGDFRKGDLIVNVGGREVATWSTAFLELLDKSLSRERVVVEVLDAEEVRRERVLDFSRLDDGVDRSELLEIIGFELFRPSLPAVVGMIESGSPAEKAGLQEGDRVVSADGRGVTGWEDWVQYIRANPDRDIRIEVERAGRTLALVIRPDRIESDNGDIGRIGAGVHMPEEFAERMTATERYGPLEGLTAGVQRTWDMTRLTFSILGNMVMGNVAVSNIGGPVRIAQYAGYSADAGLVQFISFLALISISLGVINLLPIPVLDGGHLLYNLIELIKGSPVSESAQLVGQKIGIAMILGIMTLAIYNDIIHIAG